MFPCFDQIDFKASFKLKIIAPASWKVISNGAVGSTKKPLKDTFQKYSFKNFDPNTLITKFHKTPPINLSHYSIIAGPFERISNNTGHCNVKMSLFCGKSKEKQVKSQSQVSLDLHTSNVNNRYYLL